MRNIAAFLVIFVLLGSAGAVPDPDLIVEQVRLTLFKVSRSWMSLTPSTLISMEPSVDFFKAQSLRGFKGQLQQPEQCHVATVSSGGVWPGFWITGSIVKKRQGKQ